MFFPANTCYHALIFDDEDEYVEYIAIATSQIEADPKNYVALNNRGVAFSELGDITAARKDFLAACELAPLDSVPHLNLATLLERTEDLEGALTAITEAIHLSPTNPSYHFVRADIYKLMGNQSASEQEKQAATQLRAASSTS